MMKRCDEKHNMPVKLKTVLSMKDVDDALTRTIKDLPGGITPLDTKLDQSIISNCDSYTRARWLIIQRGTIHWKRR